MNGSNPVVDKSRCVRHTSLKTHTRGGNKFRAGYARTFSEISPFAKSIAIDGFAGETINRPESIELCVECGKSYVLRKMTRREAGWTCHICKSNCYGHKTDSLPTGFLKDLN